MKLYMALNMHYPVAELFTREQITLHLKKKHTQCHPDLDENLIEFTVDIPEDQVVKIEEFVEDHTKLEPGLYDNGFNWIFKGDPTKITNTKTLKKARLNATEDIPRVSIVAVVDRDALVTPTWYHHPDIKATIDRYQPKWGAKGYVQSKVGNDKIRIDYIPITVNPTAAQALITTLMGFGETLMEQLPSVLTDHDSKQDFLDL